MRGLIALDGHIMRFIALLLLPWMAAISGAFEPVAIDVTYTHLGQQRMTALMGEGSVGNQTIWLNANDVRRFGWELRGRGSNQAEIGAEGRTIRVPLHRIQNVDYVELDGALRSLGAIAEWSANRRNLAVFSQIRNVESVENGIRIDGTLAAKPNIFKLSGPDRFVIDLLGAKLDESRIGELPSGWRVGQFQPNVVRIVIEDPAVAVQPVQVVEPTRSLRLTFSAKIDPADPTPPVVIKPDEGTQTSDVPNPTLVSAPRFTAQSQTEVLMSTAIQGDLQQQPSAKYITPTEIQISIPYSAPMEAGSSNPGVINIAHCTWTGGSGATVITIHTQVPMIFHLAVVENMVTMRLTRPAVSDGRVAGKVVVIDPGHGGRDPGAVHGGVREKDLALRTSLLLAEELRKAGLSVVMTRNDDRAVALADRATIANNSNAAIFISVHYNATVTPNGASGTMTFHHRTSTTGRLLAECIQSELGKVAKLPNLGVRSDGTIYQNGFSVLRNTRMPGVLLELGFLSHSTDRARVQEQEFQTSSAKAIARGVLIFLGAGAPNN